MLEKNRIVAYSFLAHINDNTSEIKDLTALYEPLVTRAIVFLFNEGCRRGVLNDIKEVVDNLYGIDIPYPYLEKVLNRVADNNKNNDKYDFILHHDKSFRISRCGLPGYGEVVKKQESDIAWLEKQYTSFLEVHGLNSDGSASLFEFLDHNRVELSGYMSGRSEQVDLSEYTIQAEFVNTLEYSSREYDVIRKIYLGSIVVSYLEMEVEPSSCTDMELLLDTSFLVGLFDLASSESYHTCSAVVSMAKSLGYTLSVMDITIEETESLLRRIGRDLATSVFAKCSPETIESACDRRDLSRTDLERLAGKVRSIVLEEHKFKEIKISSEFRQRASESSIYRHTIDRAVNPAGAPHDGIAFFYVTEKRGRSVEFFNECKCLFIGNSPHNRGMALRRANGSFYERVHASTLVNFLWLSSPNTLDADMGRLGLTRLVSSTLQANLPDINVLTELDENIKRYARANIDPQDLALLAQRSAVAATENITRLYDASKASEQEFGDEVQRQVRILRGEQAKQERLISNMKLKTEELQEEKEEKEKLLDATREETKKSLKAAQAESLQNEQDTLSKALTQLERTERAVRFNSEKAINWRTFWIVVTLVLIWLILHGIALLVGWDRMELWINLAGSLPTLVTAVYFAAKRKSVSPRQIYNLNSRPNLYLHR